MDMINLLTPLYYVIALFGFIVCDLLVCHFYLRVPLQAPLLIRAVLANAIALILMSVLEYGTIIGFTGPLLKRLFQRLYVFIFGLIKIAIYGNSLPYQECFKVTISRPIVAIFVSTGIAGTVMGILILLKMAFLRS